ncbi:MAG: hypothetical protein AAGC67_17105 [Myxococcota bacterium]
MVDLIGHLAHRLAHVGDQRRRLLDRFFLAIRGVDQTPESFVDPRRQGGRAGEKPFRLPERFGARGPFGPPTRRRVRNGLAVERHKATHVLRACAGQNNEINLVRLDTSRRKVCLKLT